MGDFLWYVLGFLVLLAAGYVVVRAWSYAYFRTRMEHFRNVMREASSEKSTKGEKDNG